VSVGVVTALTVLLAAPAVRGMLVGATTPLEASVRLLAALLVAMAGEAALRRLLPPPPPPSEAAGSAAGVPRQRSAPPAAVSQVIPEELAERLRVGDDGGR